MLVAGVIITVFRLVTVTEYHATAGAYIGSIKGALYPHFPFSSPLSIHSFPSLLIPFP